MFSFLQVGHQFWDIVYFILWFLACQKVSFFLLRESELPFDNLLTKSCYHNICIRTTLIPDQYYVIKYFVIKTFRSLKGTKMTPSCCDLAALHLCQPCPSQEPLPPDPGWAEECDLWPRGHDARADEEGAQLGIQQDIELRCQWKYIFENGCREQLRKSAASFISLECLKWNS